MKKNKLMVLAVLVIMISGIVISTGCSSASRAKFSGLGNKHLIEMYSGGKLIRSWISAGKVLSEAQSDGYYFQDYKTGKLIEVAGDVVITQLEGDEYKNISLVKHTEYVSE